MFLALSVAITRNSAFPSPICVVSIPEILNEPAGSEVSNETEFVISVNEISPGFLTFKAHFHSEFDAGGFKSEIVPSMEIVLFTSEFSDGFEYVIVGAVLSNVKFTRSEEVVFPALSVTFT